MRAVCLQPVFSEYIPADVQDGILHISMEYATATHLCACGCGAKVVTPLGRAGWALTFDGTITLRPSIGNGQMPCRSHYLISRNHVDWLRPMAPWAAQAAVTRDRAALDHPLAASAGPMARWATLLRRLRRPSRDRQS